MKTVYIVLPDKTNNINPKYSNQIIYLLKWFQKYISKDIKKISFRNVEDIENENI